MSHADETISPSGSPILHHAQAKGFDTLYYTAHLHTGVLVAPPFVAKALGE